MKLLLTFVLIFMCSCSKKPEVDLKLQGSVFISDLQGIYESGFPKDLQNEVGGEHDYRGIPVVVFMRYLPLASGKTCDLWIYYKWDATNPSSKEWRQCLRFSARAYTELSVKFDEENDRLQIFGIQGYKGERKLLLTRESFHDSFTGYFSDHG